MENSYGLKIANRYSLFADSESTDTSELLQKKQQLDAEERKVSKIAAEKEKQDKIEKQNQYKLMRETIEDQNTNDDKKPVQKFNKNSENQRGRSDRNNYRGNDRNREEPKNGGFNRETVNRENHRGDRNNYRGNNYKSEEQKGGDLNRETVNRENHRGDRNNYRRNNDGREEPKNGGFKSDNYRGDRNNYRDKKRVESNNGDSNSEGNDLVKPDDRDKQVQDVEGNGNRNNGKRVSFEKRYNDNKVGEQENSQTDATNKETANTEASAEVEEEATPKVEEPQQFTLDEWKAKLASRAKPQHKLRQAGEGEDQSQWKGMVEMKKKSEEEENTEKVEFDVSQYLQRWGRKKHVSPGIVFEFNDGRRSGGADRGRGGPRPERGARPNRDGQRPRRFAERDENGENLQKEDLKSDERVINVEDERAFPSLS